MKPYAVVKRNHRRSDFSTERERKRDTGRTAVRELGNGLQRGPRRGGGCLQPPSQVGSSDQHALPASLPPGALWTPLQGPPNASGSHAVTHRGGTSALGQPLVLMRFRQPPPRRLRPGFSGFPDTLCRVDLALATVALFLTQPLAARGLQQGLAGGGYLDTRASSGCWRYLEITRKPRFLGIFFHF